MEIGNYTYEEYVELAASFHGGVAPGLLLGGYMVDLALKNLPEGEFFDTICETPSCLPDSIQLLTPCSIGNGWLTVLDFGKYAVTFFEKFEGAGVRISIDMEKLKAWPEFNSWFLKLKPKKEQDTALLLSEIRNAGTTVLNVQQVHVDPDKIRRRRMGPTALCPVCKEAYPVRDGDRCLGCGENSPYTYVKASK